MEEESILDGFKSLQEAVTHGFASLDEKLAVMARLKDAIRAILARLDGSDARARALESRASALEARIEAVERLALARLGGAGGGGPTETRLSPDDARAAIARIERNLAGPAGDGHGPRGTD